LAVCWGGIGFPEGGEGLGEGERGWLGFVEGCKGVLLGADGKLRSELNYPGKYIRTIHAPAVSLSPYTMHGQKNGKAIMVVILSVSSVVDVNEKALRQAQIPFQASALKLKRK
jgi:hypothetical protein